METKKEIRFFFLPDFEKEERYLSEQHRQGWKFVENRYGYLFVFEKTIPDDVVYQLDFRPKAIDKEEYLQFFNDYGWEYVGDCNHFSYFRKKRAGEANEVYSDRQSKVDMIGRILKGQFLLAVLVFVGMSFLFYGLKMYGGILGMALVCLPIFLYSLIGLVRLRQKYQEVG